MQETAAHSGARGAAALPLLPVIVVFALLSLGIFGYGVFLHLSPKPVPPSLAAHGKPAAHARRAKHNPTAAAAPPSVTASPDDLAFRALLAGGLGLFLSVLAGLGLVRSQQESQHQTLHRLLQGERAAWEKQRGAFDKQREKLIAELQEAQQHKVEIDSLRQSASRQFQEFFRTLPVACFCFAADGGIVRWNAACEAQYGVLAAQAMETTLWEVVVPADERAAMEAWVRRVLAGESVLDVERRDRRADGSVSLVRSSMVPMYDANREIVGGLSASFDITAIVQREQEIAALQKTGTDLEQVRAALELQKGETARLQALLIPTAETEEPVAVVVMPERDFVTGLSGHRLFQERLRHETERAHRYNTPLSVIVLDLDDFGKYNQKFGYEAGDLALKLVAGLLESKVRTVDLVARYDADAFAIILPETSDAGTRVAAERIRIGIAGIAETEARLSACLGVAMLTPEMASSDALLAHALEALCCAKTLGANTIAHHGELAAPVIRKEKRTRKLN